MKIKPLSDRLIVKAHEAEEKTASGIILPDTAKEKPQMGDIVAVGEGKVNDAGKLIKMSLKKGDTILYGKQCSKAEHKIDGETYIIISVNEIMSIVKES